MLGEQLHNCNPVKHGHAICLPHKDEGIPLSALPKDTQQASLPACSPHYPFFMLSAKQKTVNTIFLSLLVEPQVYRLRSGRSNHYTIAPVFVHLHLRIIFFQFFNSINYNLFNVAKEGDSKFICIKQFINFCHFTQFRTRNFSDQKNVRG